MKGNAKGASSKARRRSDAEAAPFSGKVLPFPTLTNIPGRRGRRLLRTREVRQMLGLGKDALNTLIWNRELAIIRFHANGPIYIDVRDVEQLIRRHRSYFDGSPCPDSSEPDVK